MDEIFFQIVILHDNLTTTLFSTLYRCSISVNGVCLTATELKDETFKVGLAPETLRRTYLGNLEAGEPVNLERASEIGGRNSGHFVQGHVDGVGEIIDRWTDEDSLFFKVKVDQDLLRYIVPKGFIAIDGTSLTVCEVDSRVEESWFTFMLVEYTQKKIIIPKKDKGGLLNIEVDVLGKYSESALAAIMPRIEELEAKVKDLEAKLEDAEKS
jgi:riboflavin synthase